MLKMRLRVYFFSVKLVQGEAAASSDSVGGITITYYVLHKNRPISIAIYFESLAPAVAYLFLAHCI